MERMLKSAQKGMLPFLAVISTCAGVERVLVRGTSVACVHCMSTFGCVVVLLHFPCLADQLHVRAIAVCCDV